LCTQRFPIVYAVSEIADLNGKPTGGIISFKVDMHSGQLTQQSVQPSQGKGPCHLSLDATGKSLLAANYGSGSVICLGINNDGSLLHQLPQHKMSLVDSFNTSARAPTKVVNKVHMDTA